MALTYSIETSIRGFHVYWSVWNVTLGEVLYCERELNNAMDAFAVAVKRQDFSGTTVGHIPRELSRVAWQFLRRGGHMTCMVAGSRRRSPLIQGGLEIPWIVQFSVVQRNKLLLERLIEHFHST